MWIVTSAPAATNRATMSFCVPSALHGRLSVSIRKVHVRPLADEQFHKGSLSVGHRRIQGRPTIPAKGIDVGTVSQQETTYSHSPQISSVVQWCITAFALVIDICTMREEPIHPFRVPP